MLVASSIRTIRAIWQNYPALLKHFQIAATDRGRSSTEQVQFESLAIQLSSLTSCRNFALMHDILKELSSLSLSLQKNSIEIRSAHTQICLAHQGFVAMKSKKGPYEKEVNCEEKLFKGIRLEDNVRGLSLINRAILTIHHQHTWGENAYISCS